MIFVLNQSVKKENSTYSLCHKKSPEIQAHFLEPKLQSSTNSPHCSDFGTKSPILNSDRRLGNIFESTLARSRNWSLEPDSIPNEQIEDTTQRLRKNSKS